MHCLLLALLLSASLGLNAANEAPDLRALAKQTRPAVYLLVLQDEDGKTIVIRPGQVLRIPQSQP